MHFTRIFLYARYKHTSYRKWEILEANKPIFDMYILFILLLRCEECTIVRSASRRSEKKGKLNIHVQPNEYWIQTAFSSDIVQVVCIYLRAHIKNNQNVWYRLGNSFCIKMTFLSRNVSAKIFLFLFLIIDWLWSFVEFFCLANENMMHALWRKTTFAKISTTKINWSFVIYIYILSLSIIQIAKFGNLSSFPESKCAEKRIDDVVGGNCTQCLSQILKPKTSLNTDIHFDGGKNSPNLGGSQKNLLTIERRWKKVLKIHAIMFHM